MNKKLVDRAKQLLRAVDAGGNETGEKVERWKAHAAPGIKHLAFLVFVIGKKKRFALHKRAASKVGDSLLDSPVSHVLAGETIKQAAHRCLQHEYGIKEKLVVVQHGGFSYKKDYGDGTCENEYCLILSVEFDGKISPNPKEIVGGIIFMPIAEAIASAKSAPEKFEVWFAPALKIFAKSKKAGKFIS